MGIEKLWHKWTQKKSISEEVSVNSAEALSLPEKCSDKAVSVNKLMKELGESVQTLIQYQE